MNNYKKLEIIKDFKSVATVSHINPDTDALCSSIVFAEFLKDYFNLNVDMFADFENLPENYSPLINANDFNKKIKKYDAVFMLDAPSSARLGKFQQIYDNAKLKINIDHHATNDFSGNLNFVEIVSSTCEIIYSILKYYKYPLNKVLCNKIYAGIIADTNNFSVGAVNARTFKIMAEIIDKIDKDAVYEQIFSNNSLKNMQVLALAIQNIEVFAGGKIIFTLIDNTTAQKFDIQPQDFEGVINRLATISGNKFVCLVYPKNNAYHVSLRAKTGYDVSNIAKLHGGGGHKGAAAYETNEKIEKIKENVINILKKQL